MMTMMTKDTITIKAEIYIRIDPKDLVRASRNSSRRLRRWGTDDFDKWDIKQLLNIATKGFEAHPEYFEEGEIEIYPDFEIDGVFYKGNEKVDHTPEMERLLSETLKELQQDG